VTVTIGQRAAQPAEGDDDGVPGSRAQYQRVPAADGKPDPPAGRQALQP
jgi:hypothetical protein